MGPSPQSRALSWPRHDHDLGLDCDVVVVVIMGYDSVYYQYMPWRAAGCALSCAAGLVYCWAHVQQGSCTACLMYCPGPY